MNTHTIKTTKRSTFLSLFMLIYAALTFLITVNFCFADDSLPSGDKIMDAFVEATGGKGAYDKIRNRVSKGFLEMPQAGFKAEITLYHDNANNMYTMVESDEIGKIEKGISGDTAWEMSVMSGPRIIEGQEKIAALRDAAFDKFSNWRKYFNKAECTGIDSVDSKPCYKVVLTPQEGKAQTYFFDKQSRLMVKFETIMDHQMGEIPVEAIISDYKEIDGLLVSHTTRVIVMSQERVITSDTIEHNVEIPEDRFAIPEEIKALMEKSQ